MKFNYRGTEIESKRTIDYFNVDLDQYQDNHFSIDGISIKMMKIFVDYINLDSRRKDIRHFRHLFDLLFGLNDNISIEGLLMQLVENDQELVEIDMDHYKFFNRLTSYLGEPESYLRIWEFLREHLEKGNIVIAGGIFTTDKMSDIDVFFINRSLEDINKFLAEVERVFDSDEYTPKYIWTGDHGDSGIMSGKFEPVKYVNDNVRTFMFGKTHIDFVVKVFKTESELLHEFDVQPCQVVYKQRKFFATKTAVISRRSKIILFDQKMLDANPIRYIKRLMKYSNRGYRLEAHNHAVAKHYIWADEFKEVTDSTPMLF